MNNPKHVAIIMDGNGRWAQKRHHPRVFGHIRGSSRVRSIVEEADRQGIQALTLFAFSSENWARPDGEKDVLWKLLKRYITRELEVLQRKNVQLHFLGELSRLSPDLQAVLLRAKQILAGNTGLKLNFAISYGSRAEIFRAAQGFAKDCLTDPSLLDSTAELDFQKYFWTNEIGPLAEVDLMIRTSGEKRISNFLLWQAAYAELVFFDINWPDFGPEHLRQALEEYQGRRRRFGGL